MESKQGEKVVFEPCDSVTLVFILTGKARVSCNEFLDVPFQGGEMCLFPINSDCIWEAITDTTCLVLTGNGEMSECDSRLMKNNADAWLNTVPSFQPLEIKPVLKKFLDSVREYMEDGIMCPDLYRAKEREMAVIFRGYYSAEELMQFFIPVTSYSHEFRYFIMNNYLKMKGVKEFVDLSGMNLSTFNRKFKAHFNESPYQWMIKQKSKHIYHALSATDKDIGLIRKEFSFVDPSHFNRYCKTMFGASPTQIRNNLKHKKHIEKY